MGAMAAAPRGIDNTTVIDMVVLAPKDEAIELIMLQAKPWDGSAASVMKLQEKWQHYVGFAIHGGLERSYPQYAHLPWRIVVDCTDEPDDKTKEFLTRADEVTRKEGGSIEVRIHRHGPGGA